MRRFLILIPISFCLIGCSPVGEEEFSPASLVEKKAPISLNKTFSSPSTGRLIHSYLAPSEDGKNVWLLSFKSENHLKKGTATLLIIEQNRRAGKDEWLLLNSISLGIAKGRGKSILMRWLEPAKQKGPVLLVGDSNGGSRGYELIVLPNGWNQKNIVRQSYGDWMSRAEGSKYDYYSVDRRGFMCITETYSTYTTNESATGPNEFESKEMKYHFWNGSGWKN